ncbi:hypothetical protein K1719_023255 [Acacia pycnantha]|nr:hypothetical protein K1719_023255 [Acacia pycnantha]
MVNSMLYVLGYLFSQKKINQIFQVIKHGGRLIHYARDLGLYVMADTMYGDCCVDEVATLHINADCVIHYGQTCFSPMVEKMS